ncbi:Arc family DNA-binding protein [Agrobacterium sp. rho-13.3]|uniref:Arc family DNA-binding protein n=1 Tax=Agrobacterium sp. rho-13.3 TaxID=3072980 RepID=UPI002A0ADE5A|nr:Arc family DNA-binding protein [Agrobacterium sp. rho-13.3]MDX8307800.1 Arc family DNA-binding protein [Agrobacterium sp. rho-13.3]
MVHIIQMADDTQMKIRLPQALKDQIEASANEANRSLNAEIISRLEASYPDVVWADQGQVRRAMKRSFVESEIENLRAQIRMEEFHRVEFGKALAEVLVRLDELERHK